MIFIGNKATAYATHCKQHRLGTVREAGLIMGILLLSEPEVGVAETSGDISGKMGEVRVKAVAKYGS